MREIQSNVREIELNMRAPVARASNNRPMIKRVGMATATMMSDTMILSGMGHSVPSTGSGNWAGKKI